MMYSVEAEARELAARLIIQAEAGSHDFEADVAAAMRELSVFVAKYEGTGIDARAIFDSVIDSVAADLETKEES